jgi:hypothetical protein
MLVSCQNDHVHMFVDLLMMGWAPNFMHITAQEHWKWGHVRACAPLADFVHVTSADFPIPARSALLACKIHLSN